MIIFPRHFVRFIDGRAGNVINIAFLPGELGAHIHTLETNVRLRLDYARKLLHKHKVRYEIFEFIQETIDKGMCIKEGAHHLRFLYVRDNVRPEIYFLLIKTDATFRELWLVTFHKLRRKQFSDRTDPNAIIRPHAEPDFMG
jgi:hypothetical protein